MQMNAIHPHAMAEAATRPIAIGVLLDGSIQERWVVECIKQVLTVPGISLTAWAIASAIRRGSLPRRLHELFDMLDEYHLRCQGERLLARSDVAAELALAPTRIAMVLQGNRWCLDESGIAALQRCGVELWLCFTAVPPHQLPRSVARLGTWGIEIGEGVSATNAWAGAIEVGTGSPVTTVSIVDYAGAGDGPLYQSYGATVNTPRRNRLCAIRKGMSFFRRLLERIARERDRDRPFRPATLPAPTRYPALPAPTVSALAQLTWRLASNWVAHRTPSGRRLEQWQIAYYFSDDGDSSFRAEQLRYLVPPRDRFWADPFALEREGRYFIFFEELRYRAPKGRLAAIEVFEDAEPAEAQIVLEQPYHLSYPFVFDWEGALYMIPETGQNQKVELYRCEEFPCRWCLDRVLLDGVNAADATLWKNPDRWWMFVSIAEPGVDNTDELHLYWSKTPFGPWAAHPYNPVISDVRCARPAGPLFLRNGELYRPSQDCSMGYGHSVSINRVDLLDESGYRETPVARIAPGWTEDVLRVHTFGGHKRLRVIDCMRKR